MSEDRIIHGIVGLIFWLVFLIVKKPDCPLTAKIGMLPPVLLGTWVSDWDLWLGIAYHRSPLTHSVLPFMLFWRFTRSLSPYVLPIGFALGLASHLFWDILDYGDVRWISGRDTDRIFLALNTAILLGWTAFQKK